MEENYEVFHRTAWKPNPKWPNGREPAWGEEFFIGYAETADQARAMCKEWQEENDEGDYGDKAEFRKL